MFQLLKHMVTEMELLQKSLHANTRNSAPGLHKTTGFNPRSSYPFSAGCRILGFGI